MKDESIEFKSEFLRPFALATFAGTIFVVAILLITHGSSVDVRAMLVALATGLGLGAALTAVAIPLQKVYVNSSGIRCYNAWGIYRFITWPDMERASPINLFGLRYLRVWSRQDRNSIWIPLFLVDMSSFRVAVSTYANPGNVVSKHLMAADT